jgi:hypothetical protein
MVNLWHICTEVFLAEINTTGNTTQHDATIQHLPRKFHLELHNPLVFPVDKDANSYHKN